MNIAREHVLNALRDEFEAITQGLRHGILGRFDQGEDFLARHYHRAAGVGAK